MGNDVDDIEPNCFDPSILDSSASDLGRDFDDLFYRPTKTDQVNNTLSCLASAENMSNKYTNDQKDFGQARSLPADSRSVSPEDSSNGSSIDSPINHFRNASIASNNSDVLSPGSIGTDRFLPSGWPNPDQLTITDDGYFQSENGMLSPQNDSMIETDLEFSNKTMASAFDFESAASSPGRMKLEGGSYKNKSRSAEHSFQLQNFPAVNPFLLNHQGNSAGLYIPEEAKASKHWNGRSRSNLDTNMSFADVNGEAQLTGPASSRSNTSSQMPVETLRGPPNAMFSMGDPSSIFHSNAAVEAFIAPQLVVHPTSIKSRVETQIPIKLTLYPAPTGIKKLRLPSFAISKPKFLAKPDISTSPEILELRASVVCTSAMQDKTKRDMAFARARGEEVGVELSGNDSSDGAQNGEITPLDGADVKICAGCIQRERKRASRKKQKKPEEDELFRKDEDKRVIVFNTTEIKDWVDPPRTSEISQMAVPVGAMQVELPMRIACYCRHQNEKIGFQVLFTLVDYRGNVMAQAMSNSIMITDDHKTHPSGNNASSSSAIVDSQIPTANLFAAQSAIDMAKPFIHQAPKFSHSTSDLQALRNRSYPLTPATSNTRQKGVASSTPARGVSRNASPSDNNRSSAKRRKQNAQGKIPPGLTMSRRESSRSVRNSKSSSRTSVASSTNGQMEKPFVTPSMSPQFENGPLTPNNSDTMFFSPSDEAQAYKEPRSLLSAPNSAHASRPGSPTVMHNSISEHQETASRALDSSAWSLPPSFPPHHTQSMIHKLVPAEGSTTGGNEVTLLGSGFYPGMEVVFGDTLATTTTFWGEKCLNCLTPPAISPGTVRVVFKHEHPRLGHSQPSRPIIPKPQILFRYIDDRELQMYRIALGILGQKLGNQADAYQTAQKIMGSDSGNLWNNFQGNGHGGQHRQAPSGNTHKNKSTDLDAKMLVYLEFMDLEDSPDTAKYNMRSPSGQTLLHLGASLGLTRFVAGLLSRGANPNVQDKNYNTPLHLAALSGHIHVVHRLRLANADVDARNLRGYTPADLATSLPVHQAALIPMPHYRSRSMSSIHSVRRRKSSGSLDEFWETSSFSDFAEADDSVDQANDSDLHNGESGKYFYSGSSRLKSEIRKDRKFYFSRDGEGAPSAITPPESKISGESTRSFSPPAALIVWRNNLAAQISQFQQSVNRTFPNLPALPPMPALPDYQAHPMIQRISSLVPNRPSTSWSTNFMKDGWERLTGTSSPPAYDELYPHKDSDGDNVEKKAALIGAAIEAAADQQLTEAEADAKSSQSSFSKNDVGKLEIDRKNMSTQQREQLREAHARKMKRIRSDRNLFIIWIPLLVLIVAAMLNNHFPSIRRNASSAYDFMKSRYSTQTIGTPGVN